MKKKYPDIDRLGKVISNLEACLHLFYHMDEEEYKRMKEYITSRFDVRFPYENPSVKAVEDTSHDL